MTESKEKPMRIPESKGVNTIGRHKHGITKRELFTILDRASQPVKREVESDSELSET